MPEILVQKRLEHTQGSHNKFYQLIIEEGKMPGKRGTHHLRAQYGRIGQNPRNSIKGSFMSLARAEDAMMKLFNQKLDKGYHSVPVKDIVKAGNVGAKQKKILKKPETVATAYIDRFEGLDF